MSTRPAAATLRRPAVTALALASVFLGLLATAGPSSAAAVTAVSMTASRSSITVGEPVRLTGAVSPSRAGRVALQELQAGAWRTLNTQVLSSSRYSFIVKPTTGNHRYRAVTAASTAFAAGTSPAREVSVTARPTVSWQFVSDSIDAGAAPSLTWSTTGVPKGYSVRLQRQTGTAAAWRDVQTLPREGAGETVAVQQGRYVFRVIVLAPTGQAVAGQVRDLKSYATVEFADVLGRQSKTVQINAQLFRYVGYHGSGTVPLLNLDSTSCRSFVVNAGKSAGSSNASMSRGGVEVVQETADKQSFTVGQNEIGQFSGSLSGDAVDFNLFDASGDDSYTYANGTLSCYTADGKR